MNVTFNLFIKTVLFLIISSAFVLSGSCPPPEVVYPCSCQESNLICIKYNSNDFNSTYNLTDIFDTIGKNMSAEDGPLELLMIANTQSLEFERTLFSGLTFKELFIFENNLTKIHSNIFNETYSVLKTVYMNLNSVKDNGQDYSLFRALNSLVNLETLELDFGIHSITSIPDFAFNRAQNKLNDVIINGRIQSVGQLAFGQLSNLSKLKIMDELQSVGANSFQFETTSDEKLVIDLTYNRLTARSFENGSLSNIKRPVSLILSQNQIKYLDESVFGSFLTANSGNSLVLTKNTLNCTDCRSYWIIEQMSQLKDRITDSICITGQSVWDYQWNCMSSDSSTTSLSDDSTSSPLSSSTSIPSTINPSTSSTTNSTEFDDSSGLSLRYSSILGFILILKLIFI